MPRRKKKQVNVPEPIPRDTPAVIKGTIVPGSSQPLLTLYIGQRRVGDWWYLDMCIRAAKYWSDSVHVDGVAATSTAVVRRDDFDELLADVTVATPEKRVRRRDC